MGQSGSRSPKWILNASRAFVQPRVRVHCGAAFLDREVDELAGGVLGWEAALGLDRFSELAVQRLKRVCCVDNASYLGLEGQEGGDVLPAVAPGLPDHLQLAAPLVL